MDKNRESWLRIVGAVLAVLTAVIVVWYVRGVVTTILFSVVCAYALRPLVEAIAGPRLRLGRRTAGTSRATATGLVFILLGVTAYVLVRLSAPPLERQVVQLQARWPRFREAVTELADRADQFQEHMPPYLKRTVDSWFEGTGDLLTSTAKRGLGLTVHGVGVLVELLLVPILVFYMLADGPAIRRQALFFLPRRYLPRTELALQHADDILARYIKGQVILCAVAFAVVTLGLWAIGVDFYLLLGLVAGITRAVPIIGPIVGAIPIMVVILVTKSTALALWALAIFTLMHFLESKLLMPAVLGRQLDLHPVLIIVALLLGAQMGGVLGLFLAVPVLAALKTVVTEQRALREKLPPLTGVALPRGD